MLPPCRDSFLALGARPGDSIRVGGRSPVQKVAVRWSQLIVAFDSAVPTSVQTWPARGQHELHPPTARRWPPIRPRSAAAVIHPF